MAKAKNQVIAGDYLNQTVNGSFGIVSIEKSFGKDGQAINKDMVQSYKLVTNENYKSVSSGFFRGLIGNALLGPAWLMLRSLSAKK